MSEEKAEAPLLDDESRILMLLGLPSLFDDLAKGSRGNRDSLRGEEARGVAEGMAVGYEEAARRLRRYLSPHKHCPTCICGRRAPVQAERGLGRVDGKKMPLKGQGTVAWAEHLEAYAAYSARYGRDQSAERLAERGGFGYSEITELLGHEPTTWQPWR